MYNALIAHYGVFADAQSDLAASLIAARPRHTLQSIVIKVILSNCQKQIYNSARPERLHSASISTDMILYGFAENGVLSAAD